MKHWRLRLRPTSLQLTPWHADTWFGTLCWALLHREGEEALNRMLAPFHQNDPPFLLSDGVIDGFLPLPYSVRFQDDQGFETADEYVRAKKVKQARLLPEAMFRRACEGLPVEFDDDALKTVQNVSQLHSTINRITGTTSGGDEEHGMSLFQVNGWLSAAPGRAMNIIIAEREDGWMDRLMPLFRDIEKTGFGRKKSTGMGAFVIEGEPQAWMPPAPGEGADGFVSLSGFVPGRSDPRRGLWQTSVKHGKLGESFARTGAPFKKPFIRLEPGSCFYTEGQPGEVYGRMLTGLSDAHPEVVQYGFALPLPIRFPQRVLEAPDAVA